MAIDYTASNGSPADPRSLHYVDPNGVVLNDYAQAMSGIGRVLEFYGENGGVTQAAAAAVAVLAAGGVDQLTATHAQEVLLGEAARPGPTTRRSVACFSCS